MTVTVSVTCPNCGNTVVINLEPPICGGFAECCYNCSATVSGSYSWGNYNTPIIRYVRQVVDIRNGDGNIDLLGNK